MDELTKIYSPSCWVPGISKEQVINNFIEEIQTAYNDQLKSGIPRNLDIPYGKGENQKVDVWGDVKDKMFIFIHGGYWIEGSRKDTLSISRCAFAHGFAFSSVGYGLAIDGAPLTQTVDDAVKGVKFLLKMFPNVKTVVLGGHSAGAHLAVHALNQIRDPRISGLVLYSGIYNIAEIPKTEIGQTMNLTDEQAKQNSCDLSTLNNFDISKLVILGLKESPALIKQNRQFASEVRATRIREFENETHFSIISNMARKDSDVYSALDRFLGSL